MLPAPACVTVPPPTELRVRLPGVWIWCEAPRFIPVPARLRSRMSPLVPPPIEVAPKVVLIPAAPAAPVPVMLTGAVPVAVMMPPWVSSAP